MEAILTPALLAIICMLLGLVLKQGGETRSDVAKLKDAQTALSLAMATITASVTSVVNRVDELHKWKNAMQARELTELHAVIEEFKAGQRKEDRS